MRNNSLINNYSSFRNLKGFTDEISLTSNANQAIFDKDFLLTFFFRGGWGGRGMEILTNIFHNILKNRTKILRNYTSFSFFPSDKK